MYPEITFAAELSGGLCSFPLVRSPFSPHAIFIYPTRPGSYSYVARNFSEYRYTSSLLNEKLKLEKRDANAEQTTCELWGTRPTAGLHRSCVRTSLINSTDRQQKTKSTIIHTNVYKGVAVTGLKTPGT